MEKWIILGAALVTILNVAQSVFQTRRSAQIESRLKELETKVGLFWAFVEKEISKVLHSPHTPERDKLIEALWEGTLKKEEAVILAEDLVQMARSGKECNGTKVAAILVAAALSRRFNLNTEELFRPTRPLMEKRKSKSKGRNPTNGLTR